MVGRVVVGAGWSLITGLAGTWLALSPWALGEQSAGGDWTGAGLVALSVLGLVVVAGQIASALREGGAAPGTALQGRAARARQDASPEMDAALVALANALVADLNRQPAPAPHAPQPPQVPPAPQPAQPPQYAPGAVPPSTRPPVGAPPDGTQYPPVTPQPGQPAEPWRR